MLPSKKYLLIAIITLATLLLGFVFSGYLTLLFLGLDTQLFTWSTYYQYVHAIGQPQVAPFVGKIKWAGYVGFGLPLLVLLVAGLVLLLKKDKRSLHGDARFATGADLAKHGMFKKTGQSIVVGSHGGKLVRLDGQQFVILAAPTRSGKGVGVVIPNLLEYGESLVVLDIKQENFDLTSGWRASQGQEIYLFNPFAEDRRTHRWNPLSYVSDDPAFRVSDLMSIAAMLYPDGAEDQKFWVSQARNAFMAFTLYLFENWDDERSSGFPGGAGTPTLGAVYRLSSGDGTDLKKYLKTLSERPFLSANARSAFANMLSQADETFASILGTFKEPLNPWINPVLDKATSCNDFLLTDVRKKKMTIYIGIQPNKLAEPVDHQPVLQPADQPQHQGTAQVQPGPEVPVPAADGRIHLDRQSRDHRLGGVLHGRLQHPAAADHPEHVPARRHLRPGSVTHHHHQPCPADPVRAA